MMKDVYVLTSEMTRERCYDGEIEVTSSVLGVSEDKDELIELMKKNLDDVNEEEGEDYTFITTDWEMNKIFVECGDEAEMYYKITFI